MFLLAYYCCILLSSVQCGQKLNVFQCFLLFCITVVIFSYSFFSTNQICYGQDRKTLGNIQKHYVLYFSKFSSRTKNINISLNLKVRAIQSYYIQRCIPNPCHLILRAGRPKSHCAFIAVKFGVQSERNSFKLIAVD